MAYSKIVLNGETLMDVTSDTVDAENLLSGNTATKNDGTKVTGTNPGETLYTVSIAGDGNSNYCYISYNGTKYYNDGDNFNFKAGDTLTIYCRGNDVIINNALITLSNYSYTYTLPIGDVGIGLYYTSSTENGMVMNTYVMPIGNLNINNFGYWNVYEYYGAYVQSGTATTSATTITKNPTFSMNSTTGVITASYTGSSSITPVISSGWISQGTAGKVSTSGTSTYQLTTQAAATFYPSTTDQTISSYRWLTGAQTIKSVTTSNLSAENIAEGVVVKVGDSNNASRISQVTGTYAPTTSSLTVTPTETSQTFNATGVYGYKPVTVNAISSTYVGTGIARQSSANITFGNTTGTLIAPIGYYSESATRTLTTKASETIYPSTQDKFIGSYQWLTGMQTIKSVTTSNLSASNIAEGVVVKVGDANNASRIAQITGTYSGAVTMNIDSVAERTYSGLLSGSASFIASYAFYSNSKILQASFPNASIINNNAFDNCIFLRNLSFPSVTTIGSYAFRGCDSYNLSSISFPEALTVGSYAFYSCYSLVSANFPKASTLFSFCFASCIRLSNISFPLLSLMYQGVFQYCTALESVYFPEVNQVGYGAFSSAVNLVSANFPKATSIASSAFIYCKSLADISFPSVTYVEASAFYSCSNLQSVVFPNLQYVHGGAFAYCTNLTYFEAGNSEASLYLNSANIFMNCNNLTTVIIPKTGTMIGAGTFSQCTKLPSISMSDVILIGSSAFFACYSLSSVYMPNVTSISTSAFYNCSALTGVDFPNLNSIGNYAFLSAGLQTVNFPSLTYVGTGGFAQCHDLSVISLSAIVTLSSSAFANCWNLLSLYLLGSSVATLANTNAFSSTPISTYTTSTGGVRGSIFVPASLYDTYKTATGWSAYSARMVSV